MKLLGFLALIIGAAFALLLIVGFENFFELFRSRVAVFLLVTPIFLLFIWCVYKAFQPQKNRLPGRDRPDKLD